MPTLRLSVLALLGLVQTASAQPSNGQIAILQGTELLDQCSRKSPTADGTWHPTSADVERLEALLPSALADAPRARRLDTSRVLDISARQYAGLMRAGRRYLYGSFFPADTVSHFPDWRTKPLIICDGGSSVFGVEMDVEDGIIRRLDFNGPGWTG